jgi:CRISPR system Cascade subunit CasA
MGSLLLDGDREALQRTRLLTAGYVMVPGQAKALEFCEALLPLISAMTPEGNELIKALAEKVVEAAEVVAMQLTSSVKRGLYGERSRVAADSSVLGPVRDRFWVETETAFYDRLRDAVDEIDAAGDDLIDRKEDIRAGLGEQWRKHLQQRALAIFDDTVPIESAEADRIGDIVDARRYLVLMLQGYGPTGKKLFAALGLVAPKLKKGGTS